MNRLPLLISYTCTNRVGRDFVIKAAIAVPHPVYVSFAANTKSMLFFHRCLKPPLVHKLRSWQLNYLNYLRTEEQGAVNHPIASKKVKLSLSCEEAWSFGAIKTINSRMQAKFSGDRLGRSTRLTPRVISAQLHGLLAPGSEGFQFLS